MYVIYVARKGDPINNFSRQYHKQKTATRKSRYFIRKYGLGNVMISYTNRNPSFIRHLSLHTDEMEEINPETQEKINNALSGIIKKRFNVKPTTSDEIHSAVEKIILNRKENNGSSTE